MVLFYLTSGIFVFCFLYAVLIRESCVSEYNFEFLY